MRSSAATVTIAAVRGRSRRAVPPRGGRSWRTMWIVRLMTWVRTSAAGCCTCAAEPVPEPKPAQREGRERAGREGGGERGDPGGGAAAHVLAPCEVLTHTLCPLPVQAHAQRAGKALAKSRRRSVVAAAAATPAFAAARMLWLTRRCLALAPFAARPLARRLTAAAFAAAWPCARRRRRRTVPTWAGRLRRAWP